MACNVFAENKNDEIARKIKQNTGIDPENRRAQQVVKNKVFEHIIKQEKTIGGKNKTLHSPGVKVSFLRIEYIAANNGK